MRGRVLLGWQAEADAIRYLREDCIFDPPLTEQQARLLWERRKAAVDALGPRPTTSPPHLQMTAREREVAGRFLARHRKVLGNVIRDVVKVDPMGLVIRQFEINVDSANEYMRDAVAATWCIHNCLTTSRPYNRLQPAEVPNGWNFSLPHGEFGFVFDGDQAFGIVEGRPHVSISELNGRAILWAGYHRSYARASMVNPETNERSVLAALTDEGNLAFGPGSTNPALRDVVLGECPPLLADFFDERLFMEVELRRKRYELQVRAHRVRINVD